MMFVCALVASIVVSVQAADFIKAYSDLEYQESGAAFLHWHVEIYRKDNSYDSYDHECSGALITPSVVLSAARCFWSEKDGQLSPVDFAVAHTFGGRLDSPWRFLSYTSKILTITIPPSYRGAASKGHDDISILTLEKPVIGAKVKPICVSFDSGLDEQQLGNGNYGRMLGTLQSFGYALPSPLTTALEVPVVDLQRCKNESKPHIQPFIYDDKICTSFKPDGQGRPQSLVCRSEIGGGLAFYSGTSHSAIPYLRGIVAHPFPEKGTSYSSCTTYQFTTSTRVVRHREFIERHVPGLEGMCAKYYGTKDASDRGAQYVCNCFCNDSTDEDLSPSVA